MKRLLKVSLFLTAAGILSLSCQKELSNESNKSIAAFSLKNDSTNQCYGASIQGSYYNGVSANRTTNFVLLVVNVKSTGNYTISTDSVNGYYFSDTGFFSKTGFDTITLKAKGTPILIEVNDFSFSDSTCPFSVDVNDSTGTGLGGVDTTGTSANIDSSYTDPNPAAANSWHFTDTATGITYSGIFTAFEGAGFQNDTLFVAGQANTNTDTLFGLTLKIPSLTISPGIFPVTATNAIALQTSADQNDFYAANDITAAEAKGSSYITITSYSNHQLSASFHAYAEFNGALTLIEGSFNCTVH